MQALCHGFPRAFLDTLHPAKLRTDGHKRQAAAEETTFDVTRMHSSTLSLPCTCFVYSQLWNMKTTELC